MEEFNWEEERKVIEEKALSEHVRLHKLFNDNRAGTRRRPEKKIKGYPGVLG